uniref:Uncharacterized protein n=1 Tax=Solanum lycopersicum TaxID=4081 RepID=A0A3Q7G1W9_SOLLC
YNAAFHIPSRRTVTILEETKLWKKVFEETRPRVCLTTDTWTSIQKIHYMFFTAHFIDRNWILHKRIINFFPTSSHKVDKASSNDVTVKEMSKTLRNWGTNIFDGDHIHVRCMTHILNLIVQDWLKEIGKSVKLVRQAVKYIKQSPARNRKFKEYRESELITCKKSLCLDVPTR